MSMKNLLETFVHENICRKYKMCWKRWRQNCAKFFFSAFYLQCMDLVNVPVFCPNPTHSKWIQCHMQCQSIIAVMPCLKLNFAPNVHICTNHMPATKIFQCFTLNKHMCQLLDHCACMHFVLSNYITLLGLFMLIPFLPSFLCRMSNDHEHGIQFCSIFPCQWQWKINLHPPCKFWHNSVSNYWSSSCAIWS